MLCKLQVRNFRSLADVTIKIEALTVLFGPNGAGKSTLLDTIWFLRDCIINGVDEASSFRSHGIGALWDGADNGANITIKLETETAEYEVLFGYSSGRIEPFVGETLDSKDLKIRLIDRKIGSNKATFYHNRFKELYEVPLREPEKLALTRYLDLEEYSPQAAFELDKLLRFVHFYPSRRTDLFTLKKHGSDTSHHTRLFERCQNLWSVLQNIAGRRDADERYNTIMDFMRKCFPAFSNIVIDSTGPGRVYASFLEKGLRESVQASGVSDGHLQMLTLLTALFSEGKRQDLLLFDEPELSLHPYALAIFAEAIHLAILEWNKQVLIATHSPVLLSQFEPQNILATEQRETGETIMTRVSEMDDIKDLLENYATGSLYMAEMIAAQSKPRFEERVK